MRQELVSRFRTTYYRLRTGNELLSGFAARLRILRWRIRELRLGGFLHDPEVEKLLLTLMTEELTSVNERILFRARGVVERHRASKVRFMRPEQWTITDFPLLAGLIEGAQEDVADYQAYCRELVESLDEKLLDIEERLTKLAEWHKLFTDHVEILLLTETERPVAAIEPVNLQKSNLSEGMGNGILFITTQRLVFVGRKGFFTKETRIVNTFPLKLITGTALEGRIRRRLVIRLGDEELKLSGPSKVLEEVPEALGLATSFSEHSLVTTSGSLRVLNTKVDMTSLRNELEQLINYAISATELDLDSPVDLPRFSLDPRSYYPQNYPHTRSTIDSYEQDPLFKLEQQRFSIQSTMDFLKRQFEEGKIVDESFFKQYRTLTRELYLVERRIRELTSQTHSERDPYRG
jgi:hypothetical protein